ncbi:MAG: flavodoxin-like domain-containing protein [Puniceicoccales bacterium]|nr:flavodoxin-like domain-containing protein [Puniceicoccales bacterium]
MSKKIAIYYGTMTGNSEGLANSTFDKIKAEGGDVSLHNLVDVAPEELATNAPNAIFVVSTWGDGEPPADAEGFFEKLSTNNVDLSALKHAVFGLGDSNYEQFNKFAIALDERLIALGSKPIKKVTTADVDFENTYPSWESEVRATFGA